MAPKIYGLIGSPPYGAVLMCAKVLGIELNSEYIDLSKREHLTEEYIKKNPQHTIPLLDDDGFLLADSHAIMGYLVGKYGKENDSLYPKNDIKRRAVIDHRMQLDSSIIAARGFIITRPIVLDGIPPEQKSIDYLKEAFSILDKLLELQNTKYIADDTLSIADFSITTTVTSWGFFIPNFEQEFPHIKVYIDRMKKEEFFKVFENGLQAFQGYMQMKLGK